MSKLSCKLPNLGDQLSLALDQLERDMEDTLWLGIEIEILSVRKCPSIEGDLFGSGELDVDESEKHSSKDLLTATNVC